MVETIVKKIICEELINDEPFTRLICSGRFSPIVEFIILKYTYVTIYSDFYLPNIIIIFKATIRLSSEKKRYNNGQMNLSLNRSCNPQQTSNSKHY